MLCIVYQVLGLSCIGYYVYRMLGIRSLGIAIGALKVMHYIRRDLQRHRIRIMPKVIEVSRGPVTGRCMQG